MTLEAVEDTRRVSLSADWVELAAVLSFRGTASSADLARSRIALVEDEHDRVLINLDDEPDGHQELLEEEILDVGTELWLSDVREELATRINTLGDSYPFQIRGRGQAWRLVFDEGADRHDHLIYICCLIVTARRFGLVHHALTEMDKVLQVVAYLVAGRAIQGESYWFGYPRPDSASMKEALEKILSKMGFEAPAVVPPVWSTGDENDGGIDIIAWRNFGDRLSSRIVLYGQVASGKNWESKSVSDDVELTVNSWLKDYAQRYYIPAMFIPWLQYVTIKASRERSFRQRVADSSIRHEKIYGLTLDRGRMVELAGAEISPQNGDEPAFIDYLRGWRIRATETLTA